MRSPVIIKTESRPEEFPIPTRATKKPAARKSAGAVKKAKAPAKKVAAKKPAAKKAAKPAAKPAAVKTKKLSPGATLAASHTKLIAKTLDDNKAEEIVTLDLADKCSFADYMIVATGRSQRHVSALADHVADALKKAGYPPLNIEGKDGADWVLIDAGDVVVHLFRPEVRQFYNIEKMWAIPAAPGA